MLRSLLTGSVRRLAGGTVTGTVLVAADPPSGVYRYWIFTGQLCPGSGLSNVKNSLNPPPTRPSAKYQVLLTGGLPIGGGVGEAVGLGDGFAVGDERTGVFVAPGVGLGAPF